MSIGAYSHVSIHIYIYVYIYVCIYLYTCISMFMSLSLDIYTCRPWFGILGSFGFGILGPPRVGHQQPYEYGGSSGVEGRG